MWRRRRIVDDEETVMDPRRDGAMRRRQWRDAETTMETMQRRRWRQCGDDSGDTTEMTMRRRWTTTQLCLHEKLY
ncbi:hypothetical protein F2Q69_00022257 [Brassica cretica]|uniref:Uncharacterized protein n=1 Tax=Brassica cretica TaxID=69181 RepID=A0A8S9QAL4_BRACR|nr:hypothetical protein F2Q69_00022257 [Brassica cretica]